MKSDPLKEAAEKLNTQAPEGEQLAFINPMEALLLKEMGGSGKPAAGGVPSYKKGDVDSPPPRNYGQETRDTLQAQVDLAPQLFESEAKVSPTVCRFRAQNDARTNGSRSIKRITPRHMRKTLLPFNGSSKRGNCKG